MRDIRPDLRERLEGVTAERRLLREKMAELERREMSVKALLQEEEERWGTVQPAFNANGFAQPSATVKPRPKWVPQTPISALLLKVLLDGRPHSLNEMVEAAQQAGIDFGKKNPGRSLHFALAGLSYNKRVERIKEGNHEGEWRLVEGATDQEKVAPLSADDTGGAESQHG